MRRKDREITGRENIEPILQACKVCRVAMTGPDGWPYVIPMNFGYTWDEDGLTLYFHGGVKGKKIDSLKADPRICFELDCEEGLTGEGDLACRYSYAFSSIVGTAGSSSRRTMRRNGRALTSSCSTRPARAAGRTRMRLCPSPR